MIDNIYRPITRGEILRYARRRGATVERIRAQIRGARFEQEKRSIRRYVSRRYTMHMGRALDSGMALGFVATIAEWDRSGGLLDLRGPSIAVEPPADLYTPHWKYRLGPAVGIGISSIPLIEVDHAN